MTVKELIKKLEEVENKEMKVRLYDFDVLEWYFIDMAKVHKHNISGVNTFDIDFYSTDEER